MNITEALNLAVERGSEDPQAVAKGLVEMFPKAIEEYTREDFQNGEQPFKLPMLYSWNGLKRDQIIDKIAERAQAVGFTNYKRAYQNYTKTAPSPFEMNVGGNGGYFTKFPEQPLVLECGNKYICDDHGVQVLETAGRCYKVVCFQPIMPVEILKNLDTGVYKVRVAFRRGVKWFSEIFERSVLSQKTKIVEALSERGIAVNSENARDLVLYFSEIERLNVKHGRIPESACISRLGWREYGGKQIFVPYTDTNERLVFDGEAVFRKRFESIRTSGDFDFKTAFVKWRDCISENIRQNCAAARVFFAASVASVLVKPLGCNNFIVHIWGGTGTGKTVLAMCAASIWGNPAVGEYISSFNTTAVGVEKNLGFLQNLPLILDELQIANEKDVKKLVYFATEGAGRSRGNKYGGLQSLDEWANCILTTGERPITSMIADGGAHNRVIEIECKDSLFKDPHAVARCVMENYGVFGRAIILYLSDHKNLEAVREMYHTFIDELNRQYKISPKQVDAAALIMAADYAMTSCTFDASSALTSADIAPFLKSADEVSANVRGYAFLCEYISGHQANFGGDGERVAFEQYGSIEGDWAYIIKSRFDTICKEGGFDPVALLHWLTDNGKVQCDKENKRTVKKRIGGVSVRCVLLSLDHIEKEMSCDEYPQF